MRRAALLIATVALGAAGCGADDSQPAAAPHRAAIDADKDPYAVTCGDLSDKVASAHVGRRAQVALAAEADIETLSPLRAGQSIFYAMTELCKERRDMAYTPAADAVAAVKAGKYLADLGAP